MADRIERELVVEAPLADVWDAVIDGSWLADEVDLDLRPGGDASFRGADWERSGWVEEVSGPSQTRGRFARLAFWWAQDGEPATRVELTIEPEDEELPLTRLRVVETRPLEVLDLVGMPLPGFGGSSHGPALVAGAR
jgi:uncharacterized protein YndB with AHSA1/START domain